MKQRLRRDAAGRPYVDFSPSPPKRARPQGRIARDPETGRLLSRAAALEPRFVVGVDLGQSADYTAIVVVTRDETDATRFNVPTIDRIRGVPYPRLVAGLVDRLAAPPFAGQFELVMDATGVGLPVVEMVREAGLDPLALTITGAAKVKHGRRKVSVPKADLIEGLLVAAQNGSLKIAAGLAQGPTLIAELADMRRKLTASGNARYEARSGEHDDLVLALAMAFWRASRPSRRPGGTVRISTVEIEDGDGMDEARRHIAQHTR